MRVSIGTIKKYDWGVKSNYNFNEVNCYFPPGALSHVISRGLQRTPCTHLCTHFVRSFGTARDLGDATCKQGGSSPPSIDNIISRRGFSNINNIIPCCASPANAGRRPLALLALKSLRYARPLASRARMASRRISN